MSISTRLSATAVAAALAVLIAPPALSATLSEASLPGGSFSSAWSNPTIISNGYDTITGTGAGNQFDILAFTGLASGAQSLTFNFAAPSGIGWSYAAGGNLLFSTQPFRWGWDGTTFGVVNSNYYSPNQQVVLNLNAAFTGTLYVGLYFTYGSNLGYSISVPGNVAPPPPPPPPVTGVPLPAAGALMLAGIAGLGGLSVRRKRSKGAV
jgi:hypothetical protein